MLESSPCRFVPVFCDRFVLIFCPDFVAYFKVRRHKMSPDLPKSLGNREERVARIGLLEKPHVAPLTDFVRTLRAEMGPDYAIPYFDPLDGGVQASILYLLEAPGARAVQSGFISRNNPDETAKNFFLLNQDAGLPRTITVTWNIVPWYIGTGKKIRPAGTIDIMNGSQSLERILALLSKLRIVVFIGAKAAKARTRVAAVRPDVYRMEAPHPSPLFVNHASGNRGRILEVLREVAKRVNPRDA